MKIIFALIAFVFSLAIHAQNKPVYSMSKEKAVIYEPLNIMEPDSCDNTMKQPVSMYKNVVFEPDSVNQVIMDTTKQSGRRTKPIVTHKREN